MTIFVIRLFFLLASAVVGYQLGVLVQPGWPFASGVSAAFGVLAAVGVIGIESGLRKISIRGLSAAVFGLFFGFLMSWLLTRTLVVLPLSPRALEVARAVLTLVLCYIGMVSALRGKDEFNVVIPYVKFQRQDERQDLMILDTSVIIDGRIADICQTRFVEGCFLIPRFVLKELQQIADSQDPLKRNRGRRGLDILNKIQKSTNIDVRITEEDFPEIGEVDAKLVKLGKLVGGKILTNDFNLNKVAELQGVTVLNINELANALKPVVLPGESIEVKLVKEGKEYNQGVAYLDDGTMVVVENGRQLIGQTIKTVVTSVLQTTAGRMIFSRVEGDGRRQWN